jgi:hypothetical protein
MASGCATRQQNHSQALGPATEGIEGMTLSTEQHAATEVLAKADKWLDRRQAVSCAPPHQVAREAGRYEKSGDELAQAVVKYRKASRKER